MDTCFEIQNHIVYLEPWENMPLYKVCSTWSPFWFNLPTAAALNSMCHVTAMKAAVIRCCRWSRSCDISKYTKVFIWPHKKKSRNYKSGALVTISVSFCFLSSDLGTVDSAIQAQQKFWITVWFCTNGTQWKWLFISFQKWSILEHDIFIPQINCVPCISSILTMWQRRAFSSCVLQSTSFPAISMHCHTWPLCQILWKLSCTGYLCFQLLSCMHTSIYVCVCVLIWQGSRMMRYHSDVRV
jgi:hypothetical protein